MRQEQGGRGRFFLVVTPGLEEVAAWELKAWHPEAVFQSEHGGLSLELPLEEGFNLNRRLKTPTRILLRLAEFGCRDFPKLFRKISNFPWEEWVREPVEFSASSQGSRLRIKRRIEETCADGFRARFKKLGHELEKSDKEPLLVLVRMQDDVCFISLDTSGLLLHKRGYRDFNTEAPIRETIASALLLMLERQAAVLELPTPVELLDPMCGSGTFLLEGARLETSKTERSFAFERFVGHVKDHSDPSVRREPIFSSLVGFERDERAYAAAKNNLEKFGCEFTLLKQDLFSAEVLSSERRWVVVNPPYGERIKVEGNLSDYYVKLFEAIERVAKPEIAAFVLPDKVYPDRLKKPRGWHLVSRARFLNGGLPVTACVFHARKTSLKVQD